jgi:membrane protein insertase Oxa1/YidC/SpoIIIJ
MQSQGMETVRKYWKNWSRKICLSFLWMKKDVGIAIITLSLMSRLALLPLTLRLAGRSQQQQIKLQAIQPELQRLKKLYSNDPEKLSQKTMELYKKHNVQLLDGAGLLGTLLA